VGHYWPLQVDHQFGVVWVLYLSFVPSCWLGGRAKYLNTPLILMLLDMRLKHSTNTKGSIIILIGICALWCWALADECYGINIYWLICMGGSGRCVWHNLSLNYCFSVLIFLSHHRMPSTRTELQKIGTFRLFSPVQVHQKYASMACHFLGEHQSGQMLHLWLPSQQRILKLWIILALLLASNFRLVWFLIIVAVLLLGGTRY